MYATKTLPFALLIAFAACATNPAPKGVLPRDDSVGRNGHGGWILVERNSGSAVQGELLAASDDSIWTLTATGVHAVSRDAIQRAELGLFAAEMSGLATWMALGTLGTIGNGYFLIFTAPMWLIGGGFSLARVSRQPLYEWRKNEPLSSLAQFARFPAGIPETVDRTTLTSPMLIPRQ
jgi:hypothetical protein